MVLENPPPDFFLWIIPGLFHWLGVVGLLALAAVVISFIWITVKRGPIVAADRVYGHVAEGVKDILGMSPRRVLALAMLAFKEAIRLRVLVAFAVYLVVISFAVWFLDASGPEPAKLYLAFLLNATWILMLLLALLLSVFSLPNDITRKTIYTVVTKPVRASEIVLGRILGFAAIGTLVLAVMGLISYLVVMRQLSHVHEIVPSELTAVTPADDEENPIVFEGRTSLAMGHRHQVVIRRDGTGQTDVQRGHWHEITSSTGPDGKPRYVLGSPLGMFTARVPVYGQLRFRDRENNESGQAENVGNEWTYRQYVEGGTLAAAVWRFADVTPEKFPDGLRLQMTLSVFRTHKGDIEKPVSGSITLVNPRTPSRKSGAINFQSKEYNIDEHFIPRNLLDKSGKSLDLFDDLIDDGRLEVQISCIDPGQYFGAAQPDLYLLAREAHFLPNFIKGHLGIWLQMVLIIGFGVMFSTFLNGPVSMISTMMALVVGFFSASIAKLLAGDVPGGLTFESSYRIVMHSPMTTDMDPGVGTTVLQGLDLIIKFFLTVVTSMLPALKDFDDVPWVASGFDIPFNNLMVQAVLALGYLLPVFVAGYYFLKLREVAK